MGQRRWARGSVLSLGPRKICHRAATRCSKPRAINCAEMFASRLDRQQDHAEVEQ